MEPPVTLKPMPASSPDLLTNHTGKLFEIVYIILTGVIATIILAAGLWSWVGKLVSYLFKLAPLLWWALPAKNPAQVTPENDRPAAKGWIPDTETSSHITYLSPIFQKQVNIPQSRPQKAQQSSQTNTMGRIRKIKVLTELKIHNKNLLSKQTPAITKQIHAITPQKPAITKLLPAVNTQMPVTSQPMCVHS
ncbi:hypothetical protein DSO57_1035827 [Entomophthora muscae]|uniref:Uncharacterized protein n=1 Tax=Entomophthora muscae TaxID=34485 RepID=A0ACC2TL79_9FUNG|nr:hypothetical protein DSO57_1035827 [Entomophthora muscae]